MKRIVILGGGTGGTLIANRLRRAVRPDAAEIIVVDRDDAPRVPARAAVRPVRPGRPRRSSARAGAQLRYGISFCLAEVDHVDVDERPGAPRGRERARLRRPGHRLRRAAAAGRDRRADRARVAAGRLHLLHARRRRGAAPGAGHVRPRPAGRPPRSTCRSSARSRRWSSASSPTGYLRGRGVGDRVELTYVTPLDGAFTKPVASRQLGGLLAAKGIELETEFAPGAGRRRRGGRLVSYDDREVPFDLAVIVPLHGGAAYVGRSPGLGDELGFVPVDPHTLQARSSRTSSPSATPPTCPTSKAGSVAHFEGDVLAEQRPPVPGRGAAEPPPSTGTPTASSSPAAARRCSSTSTTTPSRCPGTTPARSGLRCSRRPA